VEYTKWPKGRSKSYKLSEPRLQVCFKIRKAGSERWRIGHVRGISRKGSDWRLQQTPARIESSHRPRSTLSHFGLCTLPVGKLWTRLHFAWNPPFFYQVNNWCSWDWSLYITCSLHKVLRKLNSRLFKEDFYKRCKMRKCVSLLKK
jgi:hypothetical protein